MHEHVAHFLAGVVLGAVAGGGLVGVVGFLVLARAMGLSAADVLRHWRG